MEPLIETFEFVLLALLYLIPVLIIAQFYKPAKDFTILLVSGVAASAPVLATMICVLFLVRYPLLGALIALVLYVINLEE